jgi:hypothetical protein
MSRFEYLRAHQDEARGFDAMMANFPDNRHDAIAAAYDFSEVGRIADIGGGNGAMLRHILARFPAPRGLLLDRDDVVRAIRPMDLLTGRIEAIGGSFFDQIPSGADIYMLVRVLHDWSDEDCLRILRACRTAIESNGILLICEQILEPDPAQGRPIDYLVDTQMMAMFGSARERTEHEFANLLSESGFMGMTRCSVSNRLTRRSRRLQSDWRGVGAGPLPPPDARVSGRRRPSSPCR